MYCLELSSSPYFQCLLNYLLQDFKPTVIPVCGSGTTTIQVFGMEIVGNHLHCFSISFRHLLMLMGNYNDIKIKQASRLYAVAPGIL